MAYTITFDANGSTFENGSTTNTINYSSDCKLVTKYSHTDNISDDGTQNSNYGNNEKKTEVVTIDGATSLTVTVTYGGESDTYDWVSIFSGSHPTYTAASNYSSADIVQKLGGGSHTSQTKTYTVSGDSVTFAWRSDSSSCGDGYGYYAVVTATTGTVTGTYVKPTTPDGKKFIGWSTDESATEATYAKDGSDIPIDQNLTLYAVYIDFYWIDDWTYVIDSYGNLELRTYNGDETDYVLPCTATVDGTTYPVSLWVAGRTSYNSSKPSDGHDFGTIENLSFEKGFNSNITVSKDSYGYGWTHLFSYNTKLKSIDFTNFDTSQVTDMYYMFCSCSSLTSLDLSNFNTSKVTNMAAMFQDCSSLTSLDVSSFNTSQVTYMYNMFYNCSSLTSLDLSNFITSKVTNMSSMFYNCSSLTSLDLSSFDTSQVTFMYYMFCGCNSLTSLDLSNFNTSQVTNMSDMFLYCNFLTNLDLSNFDTSKVTNMSGMFLKSYSPSSITCVINISN